MRSQLPGTGTSEAEVTHIDSHGFWLFVGEREYFLPYESFPWFRKATVDAILDVQLLHDRHLHWPQLDVDLTVEMIENPRDYPLVSK